ncbi:TPA: hypothetical protein ACH3X1_009153 [Trebouxia sp. C0004]
MENFTSEQATDSGDINSMLVARLWKVHLKLQFDAQAAEIAAASAAADAAAAAAFLAATTSMHMDDDETAAAAAPANAAEGSAAAANANSFAAATFKSVSDAHPDIDAGNMAQAKAITKIIDDPSMTAAEKQQEISTTFKCWGAQPIAVSPSDLAVVNSGRDD